MFVVPIWCYLEFCLIWLVDACLLGVINTVPRSGLAVLFTWVLRHCDLAGILFCLLRGLCVNLTLNCCFLLFTTCCLDLVDYFMICLR